MAKFPTYEEMGKKVAEKALDEFLYDGRSIREWMYIIASEDAISRQAWIPVSERLPTKEEYIANNGLFIVSDGNRTYAEYFDVYNSMKYFGEPTMDGFRVDKCVIAWMPLPEPYKTESEDKE